MKTYPCCRVFLFAISVFGSSFVGADQQSIQSIEESVSNYLLNKMEGKASVEVSSLDSRLRLTLCAIPLSHRSSSDSSSLGRVTVQTSCESEKPWRIHVQARITRLQTVWTLARAARRGDILSADMGREKEVLLGGSGARVVHSDVPVSDITSVVGFEFIQDVDAGRLLTERSLKPRTLIAKGEDVILRYSANGLKLQTRAISESDGAFDQRIQVRNPNSGKLVNARVTDHGVAEALH